jgi:aspartate/glutamate racemase
MINGLAQAGCNDMNIPETNDAIRLFSDYLRVTGVAHTDPESAGDPALIGKRLGLVNGSSWITLWANYFGRKFLPGVHLVNAGNEAVQINFMQAHQEGKPVPPQSNIDTFVNYARDLVELAKVDAILITCSTMNRAYPQVAESLKPFGIPVAQIDHPMMEAAIKHGGRVLVVATHGPTVENTQALLRETADDLGSEIAYSGLNIEKAWYQLADGDVQGHNQTLADGIRASLEAEEIGCVVLAQLSMTLFLLSYPNPVAEFGVPVFTSGQVGFEAVREILLGP